MNSQTSRIGVRVIGFLQDLTGASARKDLKRSKAASDAALDKGYESATGRYDEAFDMFTPYAEQGSEANRLYGHAIGLGTDEERAAAQSRYFSDPAMSAVLGQQSNALLRQLNARGNTYGGKAALAGARVGIENYGGWLNRLSDQGQQGGQYAGQQASIRMGQGDLDYGYGATKAGNEINYGNARAENRNTGINNLLNIAGTGAKIATAAASFSDIRLKRDVEEVGVLPSGLPVYEFSYIWAPDRHIGVMAHEAAQIFPEAISYSHDGFAMVDYSQIG